MRSRIFFKLLVLFVLVIVITTIAFDFAARRGREHFLLIGGGLGLLVGVLIATFAAHSISSRLQSIVDFAQRVAAGDLSARIDQRSSDEIATVAAFLDKTARRLERGFEELETSRKELETLLNSMQEAVIAVAADSRVLWANERMIKLIPSGVRLDAPLAETIRDPDFLRAVDSAAKSHAVQAARVSWTAVGRAFKVTAAPMPGGGAVAVLHDLTDIERVEKTRRDFIANVSHELRTPLTSIQGYAETLLDSPPSDAAVTREFLEIIRKNAARMTRLTEDLLVLARVESGEQSFKFRPVSADSLLQDAQQNFQEVARARGLELAIERNSAGCVNADPDAIHQIFTNLIDNAIKYAGTGTHIWIGAREAGNMLEFYVRDSGPGIASEHLSRLFERFYRVDKARSRESGGTGLGLAIVKHIILVHGGNVRAESELDHGSEFVFSLPLASAPVEVAG
ncbi:MAG TPA: ATP-binding protein [Terriglobales bacterium]|nr:ATP-binding protein [Terriglobales bacterium]